MFMFCFATLHCYPTAHGKHQHPCHVAGSFGCPNGLVQFCLVLSYRQDCGGH